MDCKRWYLNVFPLFEVLINVLQDLTVKETNV